MSSDVLALVYPALAVIILAVAGAIKGKKGIGEQAAPPPAPTEVLAASFVDSKSMRESATATDANTREVRAFREQQHDDSRALRGSIEELTIRIDRLIDALGDGAVTPRELANLIGTLSNLKGQKE